MLAPNVALPKREGMDDSSDDSSSEDDSSDSSSNSDSTSSEDPQDNNGEKRSSESQYKVTFSEDRFYVDFLNFKRLWANNQFFKQAEV